MHSLRQFIPKQNARYVIINITSYCVDICCYRSNYCADDVSGSESDSEIVEESKPKEESNFDMYV
jgi:hypothetical protein